MKIVSIKFPDETHGKFAVDVSKSLEALFLKACAKRELASDDHELWVENVRVEDFSVAASFALAGKKAVEIRPSKGLKSAAKKLTKRFSHQVMETDRGLVVGDRRRDTSHCHFCGTTLYDEDLITPFAKGSVRYHSDCFKCSFCFNVIASGTRVFTNEHDPTKPVCDSCFTSYKGEKNCRRCGETIRGCFVLPVERLGGDIHVECATCNLCSAALVSSSTSSGGAGGGSGFCFFEKDGELLCEKHRGLKPITNKVFRRPRKTGVWRIGEMALIRTDGERWAQGVVKRTHHGRTAEVDVNGRVYRAELADLRVTHMPVTVKEAQRDLRRGKRIEEPMAVQRQNSLASYVRIKSEPKTMEDREAEENAARKERQQARRPPKQPAPVPGRVEDQPPCSDEQNEVLQDDPGHEEEGPAEKKPHVLRYDEGEEVMALLNGEWFPAFIVAGDCETGQPFYLVDFGEGLEELVHESEARRYPYYTIGQDVEACFTGDMEWYPAVVEEVINDHNYVVKFTGDYDDRQQCSIDWIRPTLGTECPVCGSPPLIDDDGCCYFCGGIAPISEGADVANDSSNGATEEPISTEKKSVDNSSAAISRMQSEIDRLQQAVLDLEEENANLRAELDAKPSDEPVIDLTMSGVVSLNDEIEELRERLNEADARANKAEAEVEALRKASTRNRLKQSAKAVARPESLPRRPSPPSAKAPSPRAASSEKPKPLPRRPPPGVTSAPGLGRQNSLAVPLGGHGSGRGKRRVATKKE